MIKACCCSAGSISWALRVTAELASCCLLRLPFQDLDDLLGDAVTESMAKIVAGVFDGDTDALFALMIDSSIDGFIREALFGATTFLACERRIERGRLQQFLARFYEARPAEDGDQAWAGWLQAIALPGLRDLVPLANREPPI
jgi:uncharacterized protein DUF1186